MDSTDEAEFDAFVRASGVRLLRAAALLTADRGRAEDLVQLALERTCIHWRSAQVHPYAYARKVMVHQATDWWRRRRWTEQPLEGWDGSGPAPDHAEAVADRDEVMRVLRVLTPRERAVIVLRYYEDLAEVEIATALQVAPGTVKSTANRALSKLRAVARQSDPGTLEGTR